MGYEGPAPDPDALSIGTVETTFTDRRAAAAVATAATGPRYTDLTPLAPAEGLGKGRGSGLSKQVCVVCVCVCGVYVCVVCVCVCVCVCGVCVCPFLYTHARAHTQPLTPLTPAAPSLSPYPSPSYTHTLQVDPAWLARRQHGGPSPADLRILRPGDPTIALHLLLTDSPTGNVPPPLP